MWQLPLKCHFICLSVCFVFSLVCHTLLFVSVCLFVFVFQCMWFYVILYDFMWFYDCICMCICICPCDRCQEATQMSLYLFVCLLFARSCPFLFSSLKEQHCRLILGVFRHTWKSLRCVVLGNSLFDFLLHFFSGKIASQMEVSRQRTQKLKVDWIGFSESSSSGTLWCQ